MCIFSLAVFSLFVAWEFAIRACLCARCVRLSFECSGIGTLWNLLAWTYNCTHPATHIRRTLLVVATLVLLYSPPHTRTDARIPLKTTQLRTGRRRRCDALRAVHVLARPGKSYYNKLWYLKNAFVSLVLLSNYQPKRVFGRRVQSELQCARAQRRGGYKHQSGCPFVYVCVCA